MSRSSVVINGRRWFGVGVAALVLTQTGCTGNQQDPATAPSTPATPITPGHKKPGPTLRTQLGQPSRNTPVAQPGEWVTVVRVIDGDTIVVSVGSVSRSVRFIGIDTPEVGDPGADEATAHLRALVAGSQGRVQLFRAPGQDEDRYQRLLRYVYVSCPKLPGQTIDAGLDLIRRGLAIARYDSRDGYRYHPFQDDYIAADRASTPVPSPYVCL